MFPSPFFVVVLSLLLVSPCSSSIEVTHEQKSTHQAVKRQLAPGFSWGNGPMRGVNIGGWLVMEPWITPSMFESKPDWVVDEWTYGQYMSTQNDSLGEIRQHWNTWFQFDELQSIAAVGLNTIRIQIGFWSVIPLVNGEPYLVGAYDYLKLAVDWASSLNLKVMIDLHGAPASQNGFDNSGLRGTRAWFTNNTNLLRTVDALNVLTTEFTQPSYNNTVQTIELVNEPFPYNQQELQFLQSYYYQGYTAVRGVSQQSQLVVALDEAFQGLQTWQGFMTEPGWYDVALDTHVYAMFDNNVLELGYNENIEWTCSQLDYLTTSNQAHWTIVGEFTPATTDCAMWLNGRGLGARYDNTLNGTAPLTFPGDCKSKTGPTPNAFDAEYIDHLGRSFEAQTWVYEQASGWIMWTWKTEQAADWSMQNGITFGWIPTPITAKPHGPPCQNYSSKAIQSSSATLSTLGQSSWSWPKSLFAITFAILLL